MINFEHRRINFKQALVFTKKNLPPKYQIAMRNLKTNILFKVFIIIILILLLLIPTFMVQNLIDEREYTQQRAIEEVSDKWSRGQTLTGPFVSIPYDKYIRQYAPDADNDNDNDKKTYEIVKVQRWIHILPDKLDIDGRIEPMKRNRGIYEIVVYDSQMTFSGQFGPLDLKPFSIPPKDIHLDKATLNFGLSDLKGIEEQIKLKWNDEQVLFNSGTASGDVARVGINAFVPLSYNDSTGYTFAMKLNLKGSQHLYFTPVGKTTDIHLASNWKTPSFTGNYLPDDKKVDEAGTEGFTAHWNILHLNRNYPQSWTDSQHRIEASHFGVDLLIAVDKYKKSDRVAKYAILFLVLTFMVFFFTEVLNGVFIHPIQYLLVGIALILFYTLLLSFSEHMGFNAAYLLASFLVLLLIAFYTKAILHSTALGAMVSAVLLILYGFIFVIIQLEDFALLVGSVGLFAVLAVVMYFSRKIDWYSIRLGKSSE